MSLELKVALTVAIIAALSSVIAAAFQAITSYQNAKKPADLQLANFRREWIESLRLKISDFLSAKYEEINLKQHRDHAEKVKNEDLFWEITKQGVLTTSKCARLRYEIGLMLNTNEQLHQEFDIDLQEVLLSEDPKLLNEEFMSKARIILKSEWDTLKNEMKKGIRT